MAGVALPAFGYFPALGRNTPGLEAWRDLLASPGFWPALRLSFWTGTASTLLALGAALLIVAALEGSRSFRVMMRLISPLLSVPHAAAAIALAFVIAPSGLVARWLSPWATGWTRPPDALVVQDPMGLALIGGLTIKELPFLLLMILAALGQVRAGAAMRIGASLGYGRISAWFRLVLPQIWPQLRLPVYAVLAYGLSAAEMAMILGPTRPPTLAVVLLQWMGDPDLALRLRAAAAALVQFGLVLVTILGVRLAEAAIARLARGWLTTGARGQAWDGAGRAVALAVVLVVCVAAALGLAGLALWSVAGLWRFPEPLPATLSASAWTQPGLWRAAGESALIAATSVAVALALVGACLEAEYRRGAPPPHRALWLLWLPLLVPQAAFLPGMQILMLATGLDGGRGAVIFAHLVFVLPYVFLALAAPWRAWDTRAGVAAASLGAGPGRVLWQVRLPMLLRPLLTAAAVGFAVSIGQYLPTVLIGGGRVVTLTTEAVALAAGANRRLVGALALMQMVAPLLAFMLALGLPAVVFPNRRGMRP
ncbi:ABC transporter permease [Plastorhodobacter daqingensis]|uniref:ABC transporter permease n=1 Tax=Plastorhodobacter daqingensis TaxID=1387281 RepID=A0ABW2UQX4_9RHOB